MSLQGANIGAGGGSGIGTKYLSGSPPISSQAGRPITVTFWTRDTGAGDWYNWAAAQASTNFVPWAIASLTTEAMLLCYVGTSSSPNFTMVAFGYDANGAFTEIPVPGQAQPSGWVFWVVEFDATSATNYCPGIWQDGTNQTGAGGGTANGVQAFSNLCVDGATFDNAVHTWAGMPSTTLLGCLAFWSGKLSQTDITNLYNSGASAPNPKNFTPASGATLLNYYFDVGVNNLNDQKGSNNLSGVGGYTATFSSTDPPVNPASSPSGGKNPPLIVWMD